MTAKSKKTLSDREKWATVARHAQRRKDKLLSFGERAFGLLVRGKDGLWAIDPEDLYVGAALLRDGIYNETERRLAESFLSKKSDALIVGAHIGTHAIAIAGKCRSVTAIEANPNTFAFLEANVLLNRRTNIELHQTAAAEKNKTIRFLANRANSGGSKRMPRKGLKEAYIYDHPEILKIKAVSLDDYLGPRTYDLILMDIEGSEYFALKGMPKILAKAKALSVEFLPHHLKYVAGVTPRTFLSVIPPSFEWLYVPENRELVPRKDMERTLEAMYKAGEGHDGLYFLQSPVPKFILNASKQNKGLP